MADSHWAAHAAQWEQLAPPLRPTPAVVDAVAATIGDHDESVLLLGVTAEYAGLGRDLTAFDLDAGLLGRIWPGDRPDRRARVGDWRSLSTLVGAERFTAAVGDGSLNCVSYEDQIPVWRELDAVLAPGAVVAVRAFVTPDDPGTPASVRADALAGRAGGFHGFKWRLSMALAREAGHPDVAVADILDAFDALFPDREELAAVTGWQPEAVATIDVYRGSPVVYSFATAAELLAQLPASFAGTRFLPTSDYDMAERCPILVAVHAG